MFEKTFKKLGEVVGAIEDDMNKALKKANKDLDAAIAKDTADIKVHRIVTKDGHISITGEYKSLTINGRRVRLASK